MEVRLESEESEESEEEGEEEERQESEAAVATINNGILAPSLGEDFEVNWNEVEEWFANEVSSLQPSLPQQASHQQSPQQSTIEPPAQRQSSPQQSTSKSPSFKQPLQSTTEAPTPQQSEPQRTANQILIPAHSAQTQTIINLKDSLSREEKWRQDSAQQIETLKGKIKSYENRHERLRRRELESERLQETMERTEKVLEVKMMEVERRERAVKEIGVKIQEQKKEMWQERARMEEEKEKMQVEREKMDAEREKMEAEKEKMRREKEQLTAREEDLKIKGRTLKKLFDDIKREKAEKQEGRGLAREGKTLLHIPLHDGMIAGDPILQEIPSTLHQCFNNESYVCGHIKVTHDGSVKLSSWTNYKGGRTILKRHFDSDNDDEATPKKKCN